MPFKSEAQRRWMHATHPEMADRWEKHTPKGKKLPEKVGKKKKSKTESFEVRLDRALQTITESRQMRPAVIVMRRGTVIPAHHVRIVTHPTTGEKWIIAGINPGNFEKTFGNGYSVARECFVYRLPDFYSRGEWVVPERLVRQGWMDESGWAYPEDPEDPTSPYNCTRDYVRTQKFKKILTMVERNVAEVRFVESIQELEQIAGELESNRPSTLNNYENLEDTDEFGGDIGIGFEME